MSLQLEARRRLTFILQVKSNFFVDGWIVKDIKATFWRKWDGADVTTGSTINMKVLLLAPGDILLRAGEEDDSVLIMKITGHPYSHAGMIVRDSTEVLKAIDAYPGRGSYAVATINVEDFFSHSHAESGIIVRYKSDTAVPSGASGWAISQKSKLYTFDIMDEFSNDNNALYCSEFVWRCFKSQGVNLVPVPINFLSPERKEITIDALVDYAYASGEAPKYALKSKVRPRVEEQISGHSGKFIAPYQLAESRGVRKVCDVAPQDTPDSRGAPGNSKKT